RLRLTVMGRLLASTTCMPAANAVLSVSVVSAAVTSTRIGFESAWRVANVTASVADPRWPPAPLAFASGAPLPLAAARVASPQGARRVAGVHHERQVQLRGALGDRDDVDLRLGQRREDAGGDAGGPRHAEPDDHERRGAGAHFHAVDFLPSDLAPERLIEPTA